MIEVIVQTIQSKKIITPSGTGTGRKTFFIIVALGSVDEKEPWAFLQELTYLDRSSFITNRVSEENIRLLKIERSVRKKAFYMTVQMMVRVTFQGNR